VVLVVLVVLKVNLKVSLSLSPNRGVVEDVVVLDLDALA
jgi:hypothetical protein